MLDGAGLRDAWYSALESAQSNFRQLLVSHSSPDWKRINDSSNTTQSKGKGKASALPQLSDVIIHRKMSKTGYVYRAVLDVPLSDDGPSTLDAYKSVLASPELRKEWDPAVEGAQLVEMCDQFTRVVKTNFTLGWPASPRDAVTISRTFSDATTLIDISTSLPRSPNEPAYLRPSPPYVRSEVSLFAWCIQLVKPQSGENSPKQSSSRVRITCFWQHDLRAMWNFGSASSLVQQLNAMMVGFFSTVKTRGARIPLLTGFGNGVSVERVRFQIDRDALTVEYSIVPEDEEHTHSSEQGLEELHTVREHRRLTRSIECTLPAAEGWDVQLSTRASSEEVSQLPWTAHATRGSSSEDQQDDKIIFNVKHAALPNDHSVLKVILVIEFSSASSGLRLNGIPQPIEKVEERDPSLYIMSSSMLQDATSIADMSFRSQSTYNTVTTGASSTSTVSERPPLTRTSTMERSPGAEKSILSRVKRNYIYFSSLLQEPEAKWKRTTEAKGVSIAQLDSIDPTLVVYRAEATFVGLGLWDLYAAVASPGARAYWDRLYDDDVLLEDVNQLSELWHYKTKPAWPANGRDSVVLKTVYKSPTTIHVFAFSADDPNLFPNIPPVDPNVIRTQVDLQGWAIEALSPTTTLLTLLEQSDPKGWTNKTSIPQQMIASMTGIGEYAIKFGGPPVLSRLEGAKANDIRYDHDRGSFRIEYEGAASRRSPSNEDDTEKEASSPSMPVIECELRCDLDNWATSLDIVVDPPPQSIICLRRHRLSSAGGGLWITIIHDAVHAKDERLLAIVRKAPQGVAKEKGVVMVNGAKVDVDVEELPDKEAKTLAKRKRVKPVRIPLDQPPVLGVIRRRRAEWSEDSPDGQTSSIASPSSATSSEFSTSAPKFITTWTKYFNYAVEQATVTTQQAVAAISPIVAGEDSAFDSSKSPMQYALDALSFLQGLHSRSSTDGWTLVSEKDFPVQRKLVEEVSSVFPIHKGEKVIEGVSAEEIASVLTSYDCRRQWDSRFDSASILESFGAQSHTAFVVTKGGFPFRDRGFYLANLVARLNIPTSSSRRTAADTEQSNESKSAIFCVSASFSPESASSFSAAKYNSYALPVGRVFVDGWILETLDPYAAENYAIPSARCTRVVAVDYGGSIPAAVNSMINGMLPKSILSVEQYVKGMSPPPFMRLPAAGIAISTKGEDDSIEKSWTLRRRDGSRILVVNDYAPIDRIYHSVTVLNISVGAVGIPSSNSTSATPNPNNASADKTQRSNTVVPRTPSPPNNRDTSITPTSSSIKNVTSTGSVRSKSRDALRTPSMFTTRGEVRHPTDLLVSELIVDSKLYPEGYEVKVSSRIDKTKIRLSLPSEISRRNLGSDNPLPVAHTLYTLPPSPLHSSGLNVDRPPRHLLRLSLPTAQYQVSTIQDPLTGETRTAPPKPQWLSDLEDGRAIIDIEIKPSRTGSSVQTNSDASYSVIVDGQRATIFSEKESLTNIGRDELMDGRTSKMDLLVRSSGGDVEQTPQEFQVPIAVAEHLLDETPATKSPIPSSEVGAETRPASPIQDDSPTNDETQVLAPNENRPPDTSATSGLLRFLNSYPNPLFRFTSPTPPRLQKQSSSNGRTISETGSTSSRRTSTLFEKDTSGSASGGSLVVGSQTRIIGGARTYPLSTLIIVALIAFLLGSLLRSLISPADFIYVVSDLKEVEDVSRGWREIKRLVELKYIVGGWDFQIAVVRRQ
ncbi:START domain-containing protein [Abortiporus biennis]